MDAMDDAVARAREIAEAALGHPVPHALPAEDGAPIVAASVAGDPPCARVAWVSPEGDLVATPSAKSCQPLRMMFWRCSALCIHALSICLGVEAPVEKKRFSPAVQQPTAGS